MKDNIKQKVLKLKEQPCKGILIFGGGRIVYAFTEMGTTYFALPIFITHNSQPVTHNSQLPPLPFPHHGNEPF